MKRAIRNHITMVVLAILLVVLYAYMKFQGGFVSTFLFGSYTVIFLYELGFYLYPVKSWRLQRNLKETTVFTNEKITVQAELNRLLPFPIHYAEYEEEIEGELKNYYVSLFDYSNEDKQRDLSKVLSPFFKRRMTVDYELKNLPRGEHQLKRAKITVYDVFGLFEKEAVIENGTLFTVYPRPLNVRLTQQWHASLIGGDMNSDMLLQEKSVSIASVREFISGDRLSAIHWKQFAKQGELMTKEFASEKQSKLQIELFIMKSKAEGEAALETAIEYCAGAFESFKQWQQDVAVVIHKDKSEVIHTTNTAKLYRFLLKTENHENLEKQREKRTFGKEQSYLFLTASLDLYVTETIRQASDAKNCLLIYFTAEKDFTKDDQNMLHQLRSIGVRIQVITEEEKELQSGVSGV